MPLLLFTRSFIPPIPIAAFLRLLIQFAAQWFFRSRDIIFILRIFILLWNFPFALDMHSLLSKTYFLFFVFHAKASAHFFFLPQKQLSKNVDTAAFSGSTAYPISSALHPRSAWQFLAYRPCCFCRRNFICRCKIRCGNAIFLPRASFPKAPLARIMKFTYNILIYYEGDNYGQDSCTDTLLQ